MTHKNNNLDNGQLEQYVLGLVSAEEARRIEEIARSNPDVKRKISELRSALDEYANQISLPPSKTGRTRSIDEMLALNDEEFSLDDENIPATRFSIGWLLITGLICLLAFALGSGYLFRKLQLSSTELDRTRAEYAQYRNYTDHQLSGAAPLPNLPAFFEEPVTTLQLRPVQTSGNQAFVHLNETEPYAILNLATLPPPPNGQQYVIWYKLQDRHVVLSPLHSPETHPLQFVEKPDRYDSLVISLEARDVDLTDASPATPVVSGGF